MISLVLSCLVETERKQIGMEADDSSSSRRCHQHNVNHLIVDLLARPYAAEEVPVIPVALNLDAAYVDAIPF
ncbi:hypothetical protein TYRP_021071 [Tyrophagus putrescentiae]|nr:hypothetical protein TYRP_021071 [Tyrophagus putrescentiae]